MLDQAIRDAEEVARILDPDFWMDRTFLNGEIKKLINTQVGVGSITMATPQQAIKIKELTMEAIQKEGNGVKEIQKVTIDIDDYKEKNDSLVISSTETMEDAESLRKQVKAARAQADAATKLEWQRAKKEYDDSKTKTDDLKKKYIKLRDTRNALLNACTDLGKAIKAKVDGYLLEVKQKEEEAIRAKEEAERREKEAEEAAIRDKEEAERKANEAQEKLLEEEEAKKAKMSEKPPIDVAAKEQPEVEETTTTPNALPVKVYPPSPTSPPQKEEEEKTDHPDRVITPTQGLKIEIVKKQQFFIGLGLGEGIAGEVDLNGKMACERWVTIHFDRIEADARKNGLKPGDEICRGCRVAPEVE
jgi:hypothetical protein